jgi:hypothetical protein
VLRESSNNISGFGISFISKWPVSDLERGGRFVSRHVTNVSQQGLCLGLQAAKVY